MTAFYGKTPRRKGKRFANWKGIHYRASMSLRGKKLGVLLSTSPDRPGFHHGLGLAEAALAEGVEVYLYCIDEAVRGLNEPRLQLLDSSFTAALTPPNAAGSPWTRKTTGRAWRC